MPIHVVAVDMDGTFLSPGMSYDRERFLRVGGLMRERDIRFVVASGNQVHQLRSFFAPDDDVAYDAENGHIVFDAGHVEPTWIARLAPDVVSQVDAVLHDRNLPYVLCCEASAYIRSDAPAEIRALAAKYYHALEEVDDLLAVTDPPMKMAAYPTDPWAVVADLRTEFAGVVDVVVSGSRDIDLHSPGVTKATGLAHLLDGWGLSLDGVLAFGDNANDVEMLEAAGLSYGMAGSPGVVLDVADRVAPSNAEDGVLTVLEELLS